MPVPRSPAMVLSGAETSKSAKRKSAPKEDEGDGEAVGEGDSGSDSDSGSDTSMINVDFDFYNFNPDVDQIAVKRLLRQTLSHDDNLFDVHPLAELILSEGVRLGAGSIVKTDGEESDPWALVGVLDLQALEDKPALRPFLDYLRSTLPPNSPLTKHLSSAPSPSSSRTALLLSLRLLNLPIPLIPPLYRMLMSELDPDRPGRSHSPRFTHYILWGRGYSLDAGEQEVGSPTEEQPERKTKSKKAKIKNVKTVVPLTAGKFAYHPEEDFIDKVASHVHTYPFKTAPPRDSESFGVEQFGRLVLIEGSKLGTAVEAMEEACK